MEWIIPIVLGVVYMQGLLETASAYGRHYNTFSGLIVCLTWPIGIIKALVWWSYEINVRSFKNNED